MKTAFERLVCEDSEVRLFMIEEAIREQPDLIDLLCHLYAENKLYDQNILKQLALRLHRKEDLFKKCSTAIKLKTGEVITPSTAPVDYQQLHRNDVQAFFNGLFNRSAMQELLIEIVNLYNNPEMTCDQLRNIRTWPKNYPEGTKSLQFAIIQSDIKDKCIIEFFNIVNWENFFINRICYLFKNEKEMSFLAISNEQKEVLYETYHKIEDKLDLHTAIKEPEVNKYYFSHDVQYYMILKDAMELPSPEHYYLGLLEIPYHFIRNISKVEEKFNLIEKYISIRDIANQIAVLALKETRICILEDLMFGCKRYGIKSCKDAALRMCQMSTVDAYTRRNALEYLLDIFGADSVLNELMPSADNSLFELIVDMLRSDGDDRLKSEILNRYEKCPSKFFIKELIMLNIPEGLRAYINASRDAGHAMDSTDGIGEITKAISSVHNIELVPLLLDAVRLQFSDDFIDRTFYSLYGSLQTALIACAKNDFELVWTAVEDLKAELSSNLDAICFCNVLQDSILENNKMSLIKTPTEYVVKKILNTIN